MLRDIYHIEARIEPCSRNFRHVIVDGTTPDGHDVAVAA